MKKLQNKIALVTGGSRGIGKAIALHLAAEGAFVIIHYAHDKEAAEQTLTEVQTMGGKGALAQAELSGTKGIHELFEQIDKILSGKKFDILINNAGVLARVGIDAITEEQYDHMFNVNVKAPFFITQSALTRINDGGRIIHISSNLSKRPRHELGAYAMTKAAIDNFTISLAAALGARGITVNAVAPGATDTDMNKERFKDAALKTTIGNMAALKRVGVPDDIAKVVAFLASDDSAWITGQYIEASGGTGL